MFHRYRALSIFWFPFTQYLWSKPRINENFDFSFVTLRWGFLFILFGLLFWLWIISNYTKQNKWKKHFYKRKNYTSVDFWSRVTFNLAQLFIFATVVARIWTCYTNSDFLGSVWMTELWRCGTQGLLLLLLWTTGGLRWGDITCTSTRNPVPAFWFNLGHVQKHLWIVGNVKILI